MSVKYVIKSKRWCGMAAHRSNGVVVGGRVACRRITRVSIMLNWKLVYSIKTTIMLLCWHVDVTAFDVCLTAEKWQQVYRHIINKHQIRTTCEQDAAGEDSLQMSRSYNYWWSVFCRVYIDSPIVHLLTTTNTSLKSSKNHHRQQWQCYTTWISLKNAIV